MNVTLSNATIARMWLLQMGNAAERNGVNIQYCMPYPRHALQRCATLLPPPPLPSAPFQCHARRVITTLARRATRSHALCSVEIPAVTQIRASPDYVPGSIVQQWQIGVSSILAHALALAPFKDNFW